MTDAELCDARDLAKRIERDGAWAVSESFQSVVKDSRGDIVAVADGDLFNGRDFERDAEDIVAAHNALPSLVDEIDRLRVENDRLTRNGSERELCDALAEIEALRADLEIVGPPEPPSEAFTAPDGPPVPCEVCCAPIEPGSPVASWVDGERQVVAHAGRCPEPEMWLIEYVPRSSRRRDWMRVCDGSTGDDLVRPYEEALYRARDLGARTRVRLVRAKAVRP